MNVSGMESRKIYTWKEVENAFLVEIYSALLFTVHVLNHCYLHKYM